MIESSNQGSKNCLLINSKSVIRRRSLILNLLTVTHLFLNSVPALSQQDSCTPWARTKLTSTGLAKYLETIFDSQLHAFNLLALSKVKIQDTVFKSSNQCASFSLNEFKQASLNQKLNLSAQAKDKKSGKGKIEGVSPFRKFAERLSECQNIPVLQEDVVFGNSIMFSPWKLELSNIEVKNIFFSRANPIKCDVETKDSESIFYCDIDVKLQNIDIEGDLQLSFTSLQDNQTPAIPKTRWGAFVRDQIEAPEYHIRVRIDKTQADLSHLLFVNYKDLNFKIPIKALGFAFIGAYRSSDALKLDLLSDFLANIKAPQYESAIARVLAEYIKYPKRYEKDVNWLRERKAINKYRAELISKGYNDAEVEDNIQKCFAKSECSNRKSKEIELLELDVPNLGKGAAHSINISQHNRTMQFKEVSLNKMNFIKIEDLSYLLNQLNQSHSLPEEVFDYLKEFGEVTEALNQVDVQNEVQFFKWPRPAYYYIFKIIKWFLGFLLNDITVTDLNIEKQLETSDESSSSPSSLKLITVSLAQAYAKIHKSIAEVINKQFAGIPEQLRNIQKLPGVQIQNYADMAQIKNQIEQLGDNADTITNTPNKLAEYKKLHEYLVLAENAIKADFFAVDGEFLQDSPENLHRNELGFFFRRKENRCRAPYPFLETKSRYDSKSQQDPKYDVSLEITQRGFIDYVHYLFKNGNLNVCLNSPTLYPCNELKQLQLSLASEPIISCGEANKGEVEGGVFDFKLHLKARYLGTDKIPILGPIIAPFFGQMISSEKKFTVTTKGALQECNQGQICIKFTEVNLDTENSFMLKLVNFILNFTKYKSLNNILQLAVDSGSSVLNTAHRNVPFTKILQVIKNPYTCNTRVLGEVDSSREIEFDWSGVK